MERPEGKEQQVGTGDEAHLEHRWEAVFRCQASVRISTGTGVSGTGRIRDVSASGAFIETSAVLALGVPVSLFILGNSTAKGVVKRTGTVVRVADDGVGVEWNFTARGPICAEIGCEVPCSDPGSKDHT